MRMRRLDEDLRPISRAPRPDSIGRIITPLVLLPLLAPSVVLAYACTTDQGPWSAHGYLGPGNLTGTLVLLSPFAIWAASWLWKWEGDHDILEARTIVCLIAVVIGFAVCACCWVAMFQAALGNALA